MRRIVAVLALVLVYFEEKIDAQTSEFCPKKVDAHAGDSITLTKGVCNILSEAPAAQTLQFQAINYEIKPERFVLVFDGPSCLANMANVVLKTAGEVYQSSGKYLTTVHASTIANQTGADVNLLYQTGGGGATATFKKRSCGTKLSENTYTLVPTIKPGEPDAGVCIWEVQTKSEKPTKISVTKFEKAKNNELLIFEGTDCSENNLLWLSSANSTQKEVTSQTGKFIILSVPDGLEKPFELKYSSGTPDGSTGTPGGSTDAAAISTAGFLPILLIVCGLMNYS